MRFQRSAFTTGLFALALIVAGCSGQPETELTEAQTALDDARDGAQADVWAPEEYEAAMSAFDSAKREIEAQDERFAMMRSYDKAREDLATAKTEAGKARRAALANKEAAREEASMKFQEAATAIDLAREALVQAPVTKDTRVDIQLFNADLEGLDQSLDDVENMISSEDYLGASVKAEAITQSANDIAGKLNEARERLGR
jgi:hypothetical protein